MNKGGVEDDIDLAVIQEAQEYLKSINTDVSVREINILNGQYFKRFDGKRVNSFKYKITPTTGYFEELLFPRYSSGARMTINPIVYSVVAGCFGAGHATFNKLPRIPSFFRHAAIGFGLAIPYFAIQEIIAGMIVRRYGREQYFFSNILAAGTCFMAGCTVFGLSGRRSIFIYRSELISDEHLGRPTFLPVHGVDVSRHDNDIQARRVAKQVRQPRACLHRHF